MNEQQIDTLIAYLTLHPAPDGEVPRDAIHLCDGGTLPKEKQAEIQKAIDAAIGGRQRQSDGEANLQPHPRLGRLLLRPLPHQRLVLRQPVGVGRRCPRPQPDRRRRGPAVPERRGQPLLLVQAPPGAPLPVRPPRRTVPPRRLRGCRRGSGRRPCARSCGCAARARRRGSRSRSSGPGPRAARTGRTRCRRSWSRGCRSARRRRSAAGRWRGRGPRRRAAAGRLDVLDGSLRAWSAMPTRSSRSIARSCRSRGVHRPPKSIGSITFSTTVRVGSSRKNWKMTPIVRPRHTAVLPSDRFARSSPR